MYDPARAVRTNPGLTIPLAFDVARSEHGSVSLDAVYKHTGAVSDVTAGALSVGVGGGWKTDRTQLQTRLLFAPSLSTEAHTSASDRLSRTGWAVSDVTQPSRVARFSVGFSQIGTDLGQSAADNGWQTGTETLSLGADLAPARSVAASVHYMQSVAAGLATKTGDLSVRAQPTASSRFAASLSTKDDPERSDDGQVVTLSAQLAPRKDIALNADTVRTTLGGVVAAHQQISLALSPHAPFQLQTSLLLRQMGQLSTSAASFGGAFQPTSFVQFSGTYTDRTAPLTDAAAADNLDTSTARVALTPLHGVSFTGHYAQNPDDGGVPQRLAQHGLGLETSLGVLSVAGGYDWSCQYDTPTVGTTLNLGLGVRFSRALQITGGYKRALTGVGIAQTGTTLYTVGLAHNLGDRFALSMDGTRQQQVGMAAPAAPDYTASANLGMKF